MNKELEALERFKKDAVSYGEFRYDNDFYNDALYRKNIERIDKDYDLLKQALKRNEPMKIIYTIIEDYKNWKRLGEPTCPKCKSIVIDGDKFCSECGQKLDWGE